MVETLVLLDVSFSLTSEVQVSCHVEWLKPVSSIVKSLIERGTRDKVRKSYGRFFDLVEEDLRANKGASAPPMQDAGLIRSNSTMSVSSVEVPVPEANSTAADRVTRTSYWWGHAVWFMPALIALMIIALVLISVGSDNGTDISVIPGSLQFVVEGVEPVTKSAIRSAIRCLASDDTAVDSILAALVDVV